MAVDTRLNSPAFPWMCLTWAFEIAVEDGASHESPPRFDRFAANVCNAIIVDAPFCVYLLLYWKAPVKSIRAGGVAYLKTFDRAWGRTAGLPLRILRSQMEGGRTCVCAHRRPEAKQCHTPPRGAASRIRLEVPARESTILRWGPQHRISSAAPSSKLSRPGQLGVEHITQAVAEEVAAEHG
jgi:hypothetical protein